MKFKNLGLLVSTALASVNAVLNEKNCTGHPDPHFRNFNGLPFDFQDGCDVVLAKNPNTNIEIHARLTMMGGYSAVQSVGAKIGSQVVLIDSGSVSIDGIPQTTFPVNLGSSGYSLDALGTANNPLGSDYIIRFPEGSLQVGQNIGEGKFRKLMRGSSMSFKIHGVESVFQESVGLCGDWSVNSNDGTYDRNGVLLNLPPLYPNSVWNYDGTDLGHSWQVDPAQGDDDSILADATIPDDSQWNKNGTCVPNNRLNANGMRKRRLAQGTTCAICEALANPVQQEICNYDADVLGCNFVQSVLGKYYKNDSPWFADMGDVYDNLKCADVAQRQRKWRRGGKDSEDVVRALQRGRDENRDKWRTERCRRMGGECVVMCNPVDGEYYCKTGLCYIPIKVKWVADILVNRKFYPQCSCKIPVKK